MIERHQRLAALLELTPGDRVVVDLGCGDGATLGNLLAHLGHHSGTVDKALCHNVLECLPDPDRVLLEVHRVLRPGGRLVLSHPDYDTMVFTAPDLELTRRLVHAYCDTQQDWMDAVNGTIGRWLHDIAAARPSPSTQ